MAYQTCAKHGNFTDGRCPTCETQRAAAKTAAERKRNIIEDQQPIKKKGSDLSLLIIAVLVLGVTVYFLG